MATTCENCTYFVDYRRPDDELDEMNGYCCHDFVNKVQESPYGGHWTRHTLTCGLWKDGLAVFVKRPTAEAQTGDGHRPVGQSEPGTPHRPEPTPAPTPTPTPSVPETPKAPNT